MTGPAGSKASASSGVPSRLSRLLAMVPYFLAHPGISAADAAADLGTTPAQVMTDLNQLWMCGLPGYSPGDLIDLAFTEESIEVTFSAGMDRPLRLTATEASVLLVALRALIDVGVLLDTAAAQRAIAKVEKAVGTSITVTDEPGPPAPADTSTGPMSTVRDAVRLTQAVWIRYYSASRDAVSERVVDPVRVQVVDGASYLEGWCRESEGIRLFRLDRIDDARLLDEKAVVPASPDSGATLALFNADPQLPTAEIEIDPSLAWVMEYYLIDPVADPDDAAPDPDAPIAATMTYGSPDWLTRFLLGFGGRIRLQNAPEIALDVADRASAALAAYGDDT